MRISKKIRPFGPLSSKDTFALTAVSVPRRTASPAILENRLVLGTPDGGGQETPDSNADHKLVSYRP